MPSTQQSTVCTNCGLTLGGDALFCPKCGTARSRDVNGDPLMGTVIGDRFLILERLGHGGSGTIYRAEHVTLRRKVAVKVLHHELSRDDLAVERFRREATTVSALDNDHIVQIHDFGRAGDGRLYLAMELLEGETLQDIIQRERRLRVEQAVDVLLQLGEALTEAHAMGYVHRDLRPRNIWLSSRRGRTGFVKLLDFGLAKLVEHEGLAASTSLGMTFGDPKYMSPEQARGEPVDRRADIYSMGCIAYEMLVGEPPFAGGKVFDILTQHIDEVPRPPRELRADVPRWLNSIIARMLAKSPHERFVTVLGLIEALRQQTAAPELPAEGAASGDGARATEPREAAGDGGPRKQRARTSTMLYGQSTEDDAGQDGTGRGDREGGTEAQAGGGAPGAGEPSGRDPAAAASNAASPNTGEHTGEHTTEHTTEHTGEHTTEPAGASPNAPGAAAGPGAGTAGRPGGARKTNPGMPAVTAAAGDAAAGAAPVEEDAGPAGSAAQAAAETAARPDPGAGAPPARPADRARAQSEPPASEPAPAAGARAGSADPGSSDSLDGSGLSGDWFADAEGRLDESGQHRLEQARAFADPDDTSLIDGDQLYVPDRSRIIKIAGGVGGAIALIALIALLWPSSDHAPEPRAAATPPDAAATSAAAIMATIEADAAAPVAALPATIDAAVTGGPATGTGTAAPPETGTTPATATAATGNTTDRAPEPQAAATPETSRPSPAPRRTGSTRERPDRPSPPRRTGGETGSSPGDNASQDAKQAVFFSKMGQQALRSGDVFGAARHFKKALELDPRNADAIIGQGEIAYSQGSYTSAIAHFEKAARMRSRNAQVHVLLGQAYLGAGNNAKAAASFKRALHLRPGDTRAQRGYTEATGQPPP